jgi:uncharacterized membrane protein
VSTYEIYLFLHLLGAFLIAGGAVLGEVVLAATRRTQSSRVALALLTAGSRVPMLTIPGALLAIIFGSLLVMNVGYSFGEMWINISYLSWFLAIGLSAGVLGPAERSLHQLAQREVSAGREESPELMQALRDPKVSIVTHVLSGLLLLFLFLMVFKPGH